MPDTLSREALRETLSALVMDAWQDETPTESLANADAIAFRIAAHIDTLTAAVRALAADLVNDHRGIPYDVIERLDKIAPEEPHDA